eukprot:TRINITY_DN10005_c0_g1_i1.p1 TRINITY_DN10005_c0_g1~~TRINITY_DN10005_c0_g1_i1.p1  ORF type:complete len:217 (-),score=19.23 TRINITY_DN10005_c0_g1_i1:411-1061(-)
MAGVILHVRNVPCKILETDFREMMQEVGLDVDRYALYLPKKLGRQGRYNNFGYGFVTCYDGRDAELFTRAIHGFHFENIASSKRLVIEPKRGNAPVEPLQSVFGQPGSPDAGHAVTQATCDWRSTNSSFAGSLRSPASASSYFPGSTGMVEHYSASSAAQNGPRECWTASGLEGPDASNVPLTRLAVDGQAAAERFRADAGDALLDVSSKGLFRFQ